MDRIVRRQERGAGAEGHGHQQAVERVAVMGRQLRGAADVVSLEAQAVEFPFRICRSTHWRGGSGRVILPAFHLSVISSADTSLSRSAESGASIACCAVADRRFGSAANQIRVQVEQVASYSPHSCNSSALSGRNASLEYRTGEEVRVPTFGRRVTGRSSAVSLATGVEPFRMTMVSPACTSFNIRDKWVFVWWIVAAFMLRD